MIKLLMGPVFNLRIYYSLTFIETDPRLRVYFCLSTQPANIPLYFFFALKESRFASTSQSVVTCQGRALCINTRGKPTPWGFSCVVYRYEDALEMKRIQSSTHAQMWPILVRPAAQMHPAQSLVLAFGQVSAAF